MMEYLQDETYCRLVKLVLNSEGGYVNNPKDPGGATKYGITMRDNAAALAVLGVHDVHDLTLEQARQIYYNKYYRASGADILAKKSVSLAYMQFDTAVNHGVGRAAQFLRKCPGFPKINYLEGLGKNDDFWEDMYFDYLATRIEFYTEIGTWQTFGKGWMRRMVGVIKHSTEFN